MLNIPRWMVVLSAAALLGTMAGAALGADDDAVLMVLDYREKGEAKQADITARPGVIKSPLAGIPQMTVTLRTGDRLRSSRPPGERVVGLYHVANNVPARLCTVAVKYVRDGKGWRPTYRIDQEAFVVWDGKQLRAVAGDEGGAGLIQQIGGNLPNAEGYYNTIEFGLTTGPFVIDLWEVR